MARVVIFGAGDIARLAHFYFTRDSPHEVVAFTVDGAFAKAERFQGLPLAPFEEVANRYPPSEFAMFVAISYARMNRLRAEKFEAARALAHLRGKARDQALGTRFKMSADLPHARYAPAVHVAEYAEHAAAPGGARAGRVHVERLCLAARAGPKGRELLLELVGGVGQQRPHEVTRPVGEASHHALEVAAGHALECSAAQPSGALVKE